MTKSIAINTSHGALAVSRDEVFFPFESGVFGYDCVSCGAKCCGGHGYFINGGDEMEGLLRVNAAASLFLRKEKTEAADPARYTMNNLPPSCFFLTSDKRCRLQAELGMQAKPETCRLFPFNNFRLVGRTLVVTPHVSLCPIGILRPGEGDRFSGHEQLFAEMSRSGIRAPVPATCPPAPGDRLIELEQGILERITAVSQADSYEAIVDLQLSETRTVLGPHDQPDVSQYVGALRRLLGVWPDPSCDRDARLLRTLSTLTPLIRTRLLFPTERIQHSLPPWRIPFALLILQKLAAFAMQAGQEVTYQTIHQLLGAFEPTIRTLAYAERPMAWHGKASIDLSRMIDQTRYGAYVQAAKRLLPSAQAKRASALADLLTSSGDATGRLADVNETCKRLVGRIAPMDGEVDLLPETQRLRLQRWVLRFLDADALWLMAPKWWREKAA